VTRRNSLSRALRGAGEAFREIALTDKDKIHQIMYGDWHGTETDWRRTILRQCMERGLLYVELQFDPLDELPFHPSIAGSPAQVAAWLRQFADDIQGIGNAR